MKYQTAVPCGRDVAAPDLVHCFACDTMIDAYMPHTSADCKRNIQHRNLRRTLDEWTARTKR